MSEKPLFEYIKNYGFGSKTGVDIIGESSGIVFNVDSVGPVELATTSFGQTISVTALQSAVMYSAIANGGRIMQPYVVKEIRSESGTLISQTTPTVKKQVISEETASKILSALYDTVDKGTGKAAKVSGYTVAGKTGTTNDVKDVWFIGFSKNLIAGIYLGYDTPKPLGRGAGSHMAARVFADFMRVALANEKNQPFAVPDGMTFMRVNRRSGASAAEDPSGTIIQEAFKPGQRPNPAPKKQQVGRAAVVGGVF